MTHRSENNFTRSLELAALHQLDDLALRERGRTKRHLIQFPAEGVLRKLVGGASNSRVLAERDALRHGAGDVRVDPHHAFARGGFEPSIDINQNVCGNVGRATFIKHRRQMVQAADVAGRDEKGDRT